MCFDVFRAPILLHRLNAAGLADARRGDRFGIHDVTGNFEIDVLVPVLRMVDFERLGTEVGTRLNYMARHERFVFFVIPLHVWGVQQK